MRKFGVVVLALLVAITACWFLVFDGNNRELPNGGGLIAPIGGSGGAATVAITSGASNAENQASALEVGAKGTSFQDVRLRAGQGDVVAQRRLSEIYEDCMAYSHRPTVFVEGVKHLAERQPASRADIDALLKRRIELCSQVDEGAPIPLDAYDLWVRQAAKGGDLVARIRVDLMDGLAPTAAHFTKYAQEAMATGNPEALLDLSQLASRVRLDGDNSRFGPYVGRPESEVVWVSAACALGAPCSAGRRKELVCLTAGACGRLELDRMLLSGLAANERAELERAATALANDLQKK